MRCVLAGCGPAWVEIALHGVRTREPIRQSGLPPYRMMVRPVVSFETESRSSGKAGADESRTEDSCLREPKEGAMSTWSKENLRKIVETDDLHISPFRDDGKTYGTPTWIW